MRPTGIVRKMDELGRIVIPKAVRKELNINADDNPPFEIFIDESYGNRNIMLVPYEIHMDEEG